MTIDGYDPRADKDYTKFFKAARLANAADQDARQAAAEVAWSPPEQPGSLYEQLAEGAPEPDWVVDALLPAGVGQVNAQWKTGKTTLALNLARSLVTAEPFVGRFDVNVKPDEQVAFLNMELSKRQFLDWCAGMEIDDDAQQRIIPYHARESGFGVLDLSNPLAVRWLVDFFRDNEVTYAIWDPLSKLYNPARWGNGSDPNAAYNQFWVVVETIMREAGLRGMLITHHTGLSEDAANRARGASAMMDCPDVNMSYRHAGGPGEDPPDNKRYLKARGRDVDVDEFEVDYDDATRLLHSTGGGNRIDAVGETGIRKAYDYVAREQQKGNNPAKGAIKNAAGWATTGAAAQQSETYYRELLHRGYVVALPKQGAAQPHELGPNTPYEKKRLKVQKRVVPDEQQEKRTAQRRRKQ